MVTDTEVIVHRGCNPKGEQKLKDAYRVENVRRTDCYSCQVPFAASQEEVEKRTFKRRSWLLSVDSKSELCCLLTNFSSCKCPFNGRVLLEWWCDLQKCHLWEKGWLDQVNKVEDQLLTHLRSAKFDTSEKLWTLIVTKVVEACKRQIKLTARYRIVTKEILRTKEVQETILIKFGYVFFD